MERTSVQSSAVLSIGYDAAAERLEVELPGARVYEAKGVSQDEVDGFFAAESKGRAFAELKRRYTFTRVPEQPQPEPQPEAAA